MFDIFRDDFKYLKSKFYILDKLIQIYIPDLSKHFEDININSLYYSSSWFITLFTIVL